MLVPKHIQLKSMLNKLEMIVLKLEKLQKQLHLIFDNQVYIYRYIFDKNYNFINYSISFLGEDKPQIFIPLDIDRQMDGKLISNNHIVNGPPNGRLPMPSNFTPHTTMALSPHLSQQQQQQPQPTNPVTSSNYMLDGGVYQGQAPAKPLHDINSTTKVNLFSLINK